MPKDKLFEDDSEEEVSFKTENEYAKKYDSWREKEEVHKLEQKYGSEALSSDALASSDSEEDDEPPEVSEEMETQFLKTLALLKTKDPRIYDPGYKFFEEEEKEKEEQPKAKTLTFDDSDDDDEDNDGNIFKVEKKAEILNEKTEPESSDKKESSSKKTMKEGKLKDYLTGKVEHVDLEVEKDLAPLKALWSDPKLNEGEAFLRDYILNKRYLDEGEPEPEKLRDDEDLEEDEKRVEEQGKFERAYNFRFEEPDEEYLKRFPRTMNYIRPKDDRRSRKRVEVRTRKEEEKKRKMEEIARLKALKLKEIQEKIAKIKEVTGNEDLAFKDDDLEGDFDPEEHDRRMQAIFDEQYYGEADGEKPVFPDLDEELEIENWENYEPEQDRSVSLQQNNEPHCEDDDFNMDADYDPKQARASLLEKIQSTLTKKPRNRKKKSKLAELLCTEKPKFIPTVAEKTYSQYMEEYYKLDCEDVIGGDLPTRFKYRDVVPNDYGLTIEEILLADDKELTQWVPLKRIVKHRPKDIEISDVNTYRQKATDVRLKKKILPSLFKDLPEEPEIIVPVEETSKKKKKKKKNKEKVVEVQDNENPEDLNGENIEKSQDDNHAVNTSENEREGKAKKKKKKNEEDDLTVEISDDTTTENNIDNSETPSKKIKKKHKAKQIIEDLNQSKIEDNEELKSSTKPPIENSIEVPNSTETKQSKKKKKKIDGFTVESVHKEEPSQASQLNNCIVNKTVKKGNLKRKLETNNAQIPNKKKKTDFKKKGTSKLKQKDKFKNKQNVKTTDNPLNNLSDERLKAYGLNPKKYRSFLKYKKF